MTNFLAQRLIQRNDRNNWLTELREQLPPSPPIFLAPNQYRDMFDDELPQISLTQQAEEDRYLINVMRMASQRIISQETAINMINEDKYNHTIEDIEKICGLEPHKEFMRSRLEENLANVRCQEPLRQTGRTTQMLVRAIHRCMNKEHITILVVNQNSIRFHMDQLRELLEPFIQMGLNIRINNQSVFFGVWQITITCPSSNELFDPSLND